MSSSSSGAQQSALACRVDIYVTLAFVLEEGDAALGSTAEADLFHIP